MVLSRKLKIKEVSHLFLLCTFSFHTTQQTTTLVAQNVYFQTRTSRETHVIYSFSVWSIYCKLSIIFTLVSYFTLAECAANRQLPSTNQSKLLLVLTKALYLSSSSFRLCVHQKRSFSAWKIMIHIMIYIWKKWSLHISSADHFHCFRVKITILDIFLFI